MKMRNGGELHRVAHPANLERGYITSVGRLNRAHDDVDYHLYPRTPSQYHRSFENDPWLPTGTQLGHLSAFYSLATKLWTEIRNERSLLLH